MIMEKLILIGVSLIFIGVMLIFIGSLFSTSQTSESSNIKIAAGGFIGPIPFGFFNDKRMFYVLIGLMIISLFLWFFLNK